MHVFFEDDGTFKAGTILVDNEASLQAETAHGKRVKIKSSSVLLRFDSPAPLALLNAAHTLAAELDPNFLWEVCGQEEFGFTDLAREYYGHTPSPVEAAGAALCLHSHPMHFHKKGKGRYKAAPAEALKAALAGMEKRRLQAEQQSAWVGALARNEVPAALRTKLGMLLYSPDKSSLEWKALMQACDEQKTNPVTLLARCGAIPSTHDYHFNRFLNLFFPRGTGFEDFGQLPPLLSLPLAEAQPFSIDDATTTEIDDAFSVTFRQDEAFRVGIHIAAPAIGVPRGSPLDAAARGRLSTVYMPGNKITMLPESVISQFSLDAGELRPVLSMYFDVSRDGAISGGESRLECVKIAANLRHDELEQWSANESGAVSTQFARELNALANVSKRLESARKQSDIKRLDYNFTVHGDPSDDATSRIQISPRLRGSPLDKLVAELMIYVNARWGALLAQERVPGLYRTQSAGKVKMSTQPLPHEGLGVAQYLWASSPLRRYSDLINQRQLLAVIAGEKPPYAQGEGELFAAMADFEATYGGYLEFQSQMEHYWCLRWLLQEGVKVISAGVIRENLVRVEGLPIVMRVPEMPNLPSGSRARLAITRIDLLAASLECRFAGPDGELGINEAGSAVRS